MKFLFLSLSFITLPLLYGMTLDEQLIKAAETGNIQQAQEALAAGAYVHAQDSFQHKCALHKAASNRNSDINARDMYGHTPLDRVEEGSDVFIKLLLKDYAGLLEQISLKPTKDLFTHALRYSYVHAVKLLLQAGIKPNMHDLALVKEEYDRDARPLYKESYATIGRMLLQHLRLTGEMQAPEYNAIAKFYHWIIRLLWPTNANTTEYAYGPISKSGLGLPESVAHAIASFTH